jgi:hypothetical protein
VECIQNVGRNHNCKRRTRVCSSFNDAFTNSGCNHRMNGSHQKVNWKRRERMWTWPNVYYEVPAGKYFKYHENGNAFKRFACTESFAHYMCIGLKDSFR